MSQVIKKGFEKNSLNMSSSWEAVGMIILIGISRIKEGQDHTTIYNLVQPTYCPFFNQNQFSHLVLNQGSEQYAKGYTTPGMMASPCSSANAHRPWQMFRDLFSETLAVCKDAAL